MSWEIAGKVGPHHRSGYDGSGWLWEIRPAEDDGRAAEPRRVFVEISGQARRHADNFPEDTADAIASEGESEVAKVLDLENPPRVIQCGTDGCRPEEAASP